MLKHLLQNLRGRTTAPRRQAAAEAPDAGLGAEHARWMALAGERRFEEAIALCRQAVPQPEASFLASLFLGYAGFQLGRLDDAAIHLGQALALNPSDYYANLFLGRTLEAQGDARGALGRYTACCGAEGADVAEAFEAGMKVGADLRDSAEGAAFAGRYVALAQRGVIPLALAARFLFLWHRDEELQALCRSTGTAQPTAFSRIRSVEQGAAEAAGEYVCLGAPETIRIVHPSEEAQDAPALEVQSSVPYVAMVPNATIVGNSSLVHLAGSVLSDDLADARYGRMVSLAYDQTVLAQRPDALLVSVPRPAAVLDEGVMLSGLASDAFGHWFAEFLPKLRHFQRHPGFAELPLIVDAGMPPSHFDFLAALVPNRLHRIGKGEALGVRRLYLAPATTFFPTELFPGHTVPPEHQASWTAGAMRFIKERIEAGRPPPAQRRRRMFLSRKRSTWRLLTNEQDVIDALKPLGFETVFMEELDFSAQVQAFAEAEFIVAPNGSALNSLMFASPEVGALILGQQNSFNWGGWLGPMQDLGFRPQFLEGEAVGSVDFKHSDYMVSPAKVVARVQSMLAS